MWELRKSDLDSVFWMTWAEFCILSKGWERTERTSWFKVREIAWNSVISGNVDGKKLPKTKHAFMPINGEKEEQKISSKTIEVMRGATERLRKKFKKK